MPASERFTNAAISVAGLCLWLGGFAAQAQVSPCSTVELPSTTVTSNTPAPPIQYGLTDLSAGGGNTYFINTNGYGSPTGTANVMFASAGRICLGPGFQAAAASGGSFVAVIETIAGPLSINGGASSGQTLPTITDSFAFPLHSEAGANDVGWGQFILQDSSGNFQNSAGVQYCEGDWGRPSALDLYQSSTGTTNGFGISQGDTFCTVSLVSVTNSATDPTEVTVVLNFTFNPGFSGTYSVLTQVNYVEGLEVSWANVGTLTIQSPPTLNPQPTVTLTDNTQSSGYYFVGDSFTFTVTGPPNLPVSATLNSVDSGVIGNTGSAGIYSTGGSWTAANVGTFAENWYVDGVQAGAMLVFSVNSTVSSGTPQNVPNSYTATPAALTCNNISGNWIATLNTGLSVEWDLAQSNGGATGTMYVSVPYPGTGYECGVATYQNVSGSTNINGTITVSATQPNVCSTILTSQFTDNVTLTGSSCSLGTGQWTAIGNPSSGSSSWKSKTAPNNTTPTTTPTTPHYLVEYSAYIAADHVTAPTSCYYSLTHIPYLIYKGDAFRNTFRARQTAIVIGAGGGYYGFLPETGPTRNYGYGSPAGGTNANLSSTPTTSDVYFGPYTGADEDPTQYDCYLWNDRGHSPTSSMQNFTYSFNAKTVVGLNGQAANPLEPHSGPISWNLSVTIDESNPTAPVAYVRGAHTCMPRHQVKVNGTLIYDSFAYGGIPTDYDKLTFFTCLNFPATPFNVSSAPVSIGLQ